MCFNDIKAYKYDVPCVCHSYTVSYLWPEILLVALKRIYLVCATTLGFQFSTICFET